MYERRDDGGEAEWGRVLAWEPPGSLLLAWSPSPERPAPTAVEIRFAAVAADHTRVELEHRGWERLGDAAAQARAGYQEGWPRVLAAVAGAAMGAQHQWFARSLNGLVWQLLASTARTGEDDARMLDAAHASQYHWRETGGPPATRAEAMARALACAGDLDQAAAWHARATAAGAAVRDDEDRTIFAGDLASGPWFGLNGASRGSG